MSEITVGVVGLGYVGIPLAVEFAKKYKTIGFDTNEKKIEEYKKGIDVTREVGNEAINNTTIFFTTDATKLSECNRIIVAVPTPVNEDKTSDLTPVISASEIVGKNMSKGSIVIYESTVYPGLTEEICLPILEKFSGMQGGKDFKISYSPERVNPGDKVHKFENITKIVSGMDEETLENVAELYNSVLKNGIHKATSIKVAEAAKVIENSQRDVNIAFANEIAMMCHKLGIETKDVLDAASTKWNFLNFRPGLVGGHCIGVDPYYLITKLKDMGYESILLSNARKVNEEISSFIAQSLVERLKAKGIKPEDAKVKILGITFKENVNDIRNSKVIDIVKELQKDGLKVLADDPNADLNLVEQEYKVKFEKNSNEKVDALIVAVAHNEYKNMSIQDIKDKLNETSILSDIKGLFNKNEIEKEKIEYWSL